MIMRNLVLRIVATMLTVAVLALATLVLQFPAERAVARPAAAVGAAETAQTLAALKSTKRARPVIAVLGGNDGSETTDFLVPYAVLKRSGVADVYAVGIRPGPVKLMPVLTILPDMTAGEFVAQFPDGADYVIVPAMHRGDDPAVLSWLKAQAAHGAKIVGICEGAMILARAGLLHDRRATTHWAHIEDLKQADTITYVPDRRYVADRNVATTTGVSASLPISIAIVAAIAGNDRATALAQELGVGDWSQAHVSDRFELTRIDIWNYAYNILGVWRHETAGLKIADGVDGLSLAFTADGLAATHRVNVMALNDADTVATSEGLRIVIDGKPNTPVDFELAASGVMPAHALDETLARVQARYGAASVQVARLELEYPPLN